MRLPVDFPWNLEHKEAPEILLGRTKTLVSNVRCNKNKVMP